MVYLKSIQFKIILWAGSCFLLVEAILVALTTLFIQNSVERVAQHQPVTGADIPQLSGIAVILAVVALAVLWYLVRQITNRVARITRAINAMVQGDYTMPLDVTNQDQIGQLADAVRALRNHFKSNGQVQPANEAARHERDLSYLILDALPESIHTEDTETRYAFANAADMRRIGAKSRVDIIGKTARDLCSKEVADKHTAAARQVIQSGEPTIDEEQSYDQSTGRTAWHTTTRLPLRDGDGNVVGLVSIIRDVSKYREAEATLAKERNLLRTLIDTLPDSIFVKDAESRFLIANKAVAEGLNNWTLATTLTVLSPITCEILSHIICEITTGMESK